MQGQKAESNEKLYFQHFARRKRPHQTGETKAQPKLSASIQCTCNCRSTIHRAFSQNPAQVAAARRELIRETSFLCFLNFLYFLYLTSLHLYFATSIFSIPIYGRNASGITIDPSAC